MRSLFLSAFVLVLGSASPVGAATLVPKFRSVTLDAEVSIGYGLALADVDGDGRVDVVLADKHRVAWYRNPVWSRHVIAERLTELDHVCVAAADIDGDGKAEIAAGAGWNPGDTITSGALFYLKPPEDRTQRWEPVRLAHDPTIHRIRWAPDGRGGFDLLSLPLHGRGNKNGLGDGVRFLAYHPPGGKTAAWTTSLIWDGGHATHNFDVVGEAGGNRVTVLAAAREGVFQLDREGGRWRVKALAEAGSGMPDFIGAGEVRAGRGAGPFVTTIEPMHGNQLVVYQPGPAPDGLWSRTVIDESLVDGHALACGDLLGQGRDQIVAGWRAMNRPGARVGIRLYIDEEGNGREWRPHVLDDNGMACEDLQLADLDGDGDLDVVAAGRATRNLKAYYNDRIRRD